MYEELEVLTWKHGLHEREMKHVDPSPNMRKQA